MHAGDSHDVDQVLAWIPTADRDRITAIMFAEAGTRDAWTLILLAQACRQAGRTKAP